MSDIGYPEEALGPLHSPLLERPVADERTPGLYPAALSPDLIKIT